MVIGLSKLPSIILFCLFALLEIQPLFAFEPCRIEGYAFEIECQSVDVQAETNLLASKIQLQVFRVSALVRYPLPEPIFWIPNDIGVDTNKIAPTMISALSRIRNHRDFLWMSMQREGGTPIIDCEGEWAQTSGLLTIRQRIDAFSDDRFLHHCQAKVQAFKLQSFSDKAIANHYEKVRQTLGIKQVVIFTEGRGANIALAWQKIAPKAIKFQVFDSPIIVNDGSNDRSALQAQSVMDNAIQACLQNTRCQAANPTTNQDFANIVKQLPIQLTVNDPLTGASEQMMMDELLFYKIILNLLQSPSHTALLPTLLTSASKGDWQPMIGVLSLSWSKRRSTFNHGLYLASQCANDDAKRSENNEQWFYQMQLKRFNQLCGFSQQNSSKSVEQNLIDQQRTVRTPTLLLTGTLNPYDFTDFAFLRHRTHLKVANVGFGVLSYGCSRDVIYQYFKLQNKVYEDAKTIQLNQLPDCLNHIPYPSLDVTYESAR